MIISRRTARIVLTLCLLVFQLQALASVTLGCRHVQDGGADVASTGCPFHQAGSGMDDGGQPERLLDCHNCALHCALGGPANLAAPMLPTPLPIRSSAEPSPERYFYRFVPDFFSEPPIGRLS